MSFVTVKEFRLKNWPPKLDRRFFAILLFCLLLFFSEEKRSHHTNQIALAEKERRERQSPFKRVYQLTTRVKLSLSRWLFEHARTSPNTRGLGRNTHTHTLYSFGNWNGPQPRKDYEFSQREEFHDASFRRGVKGE